MPEDIFQTASRGNYFEELDVGQTFISPRRTVTQTDIVNFACLSGDFNAAHVDEEFCKEQQYEVPLAHGPLVLAIATGLTYQTGFHQGTVAAMIKMHSWDIYGPVKAGDTIGVRVTIKDKKPTSKGKYGKIQFFREVINQRGEVVQTMLVENLILCRPAEAA